MASEQTVHQPTVLRVNGEQRELELDKRTTLLDVLREHLDLTGAKKGCDHGQCGACTVLLDGRRANALPALAVAADGAEVTTIEGLADGDELHPLQQAFVDHDALPVRLLHARPDLLGGRHARRGPRAGRAPSPPTCRRRRRSTTTRSASA